MTQIIPENCDPEFDNDYFYLIEKQGDYNIFCSKDTIQNLENVYQISKNQDKYIIYKPYRNSKGEYKEAIFYSKPIEE